MAVAGIMTRSIIMVAMLLNKHSTTRFIAKARMALLLVASTLLLIPQTVSAVEKYTKQSAANAMIQARLTARQLNPKSAHQLFVIASELYRDNFIFEARELSELLCKSKFVTADEYVLLATTYVSVMGDEGNAKPVEQYLVKALALDPNCVGAYYLKAKLANQEARFADALNFTDKGLVISIGNPDLLELKAEALENLDRPQEALQTIEAALQKKTTEPSLYRIKGGILENMKRYNEAAANYRASLKLYNIDWAVFRLVRCLEAQQKYDEAIGELTKLIAKNPRDGEAFRTRAMLKVKVKDIAGAIKDYDSCITLEPTAKTFKERAQLHLQCGHKDLYKRDLAEAQKLDASPF